ncbi:hypothetical protein D9V37_13980 [Nocardioides mangrovicus]|uniref:Uncharacterized protein n=1 Tax=Nocardioides mangrovicus TaxID=2478913 RepID=A0A3L8P0P1_9ACTN|nr:hypothetical protein [Nocardioides mangrovicus]RLV48487.1 hypothetical protein D9V37_13980 [Nocardioides mangrovicus]
MVFWTIVVVVLLVAFALAFRSDRRRRGSRIDQSRISSAKDKAMREGTTIQPGTRGMPPGPGGGF